MENVVNVRQLLTIPKRRFLTDIQTNMYVRYEDGVVMHLTKHEVILNRYLLAPLELVSTVPITSDMCGKQYYKAAMCVKDVMNKTFSAIIRGVNNTIVIPEMDRSVMSEMYKSLYESMNDIFDDIVCGNLEYVSSTSIIDYVMVQQDKDLLAAIEEAKMNPSEETVSNTYAVLDTVMHKPEFSNNALARRYLSGTSNPKQIGQLLAVRGYVTEMDNTVFKKPITSSFCMGLSSMYEMAAESRSAAKALFTTDKSIQQSEYFAREMHLAVSSTSVLADGDCGNDIYTPWLVRGPTETSNGDLRNIIGKYRLCDDGAERPIMESDTHLINTYVKIRQSNSCKHPDPNTICTRCFGLLSSNVPMHSGIGGLCITIITKFITQILLSDKHYTASSSASWLKPCEIGKQFFSVKNKDSLAFKANTLNKARSKLYMYVDQKDAYGLREISKGVDVDRLNISRVTAVSSLTLVSVDKDGKSTPYPINIKNSGKHGNFTHKFLKFIISKKPEVDNYDRYVIDLTGWETGVPFIRIQQVAFNFLMLATAIKSKFKHMELDNYGNGLSTVDAFTQEVFDIVNSKLLINLALIEVVVRGFTCADIPNGDYGLGGRTDTARPSSIKNVITHRSLGGSLGWEGVKNTLLSSSSFDGRNAVDHQLDVLLKPNEHLGVRVN